MKFTLLIDKTAPEEVIAKVHSPSTLTQQIEALVLAHDKADRILAYTEDDMRILSFSQIECITVLNGKTYAIDTCGKQYRLKRQLVPILIFTTVFITGYALIWLCIYYFTKAKTNKLNRQLKS